MRAVCLPSYEPGPVADYYAFFLGDLAVEQLEDIYISLRNLEYEFTALLGTLYRQKHAFRSLQHAIKDLQVRRNTSMTQ